MANCPSAQCDAHLADALTADQERISRARAELTTVWTSYDDRFRTLHERCNRLTAERDALQQRINDLTRSQTTMEQGAAPASQRISTVTDASASASAPTVPPAPASESTQHPRETSQTVVIRKPSQRTVRIQVGQSGTSGTAPAASSSSPSPFQCLLSHEAASRSSLVIEQSTVFGRIIATFFVLGSRLQANEELDAAREDIEYDLQMAVFRDDVLAAVGELELSETRDRCRLLGSEAEAFSAIVGGEAEMRLRRARRVLANVEASDRQLAAEWQRVRVAEDEVAAHARAIDDALSEAAAMRTLAAADSLLAYSPEPRAPAPASRGGSGRVSDETLPSGGATNTSSPAASQQQQERMRHAAHQVAELQQMLRKLQRVTSHVMSASQSHVASVDASARSFSSVEGSGAERHHSQHPQASSLGSSRGADPAGGMCAGGSRLSQHHHQAVSAARSAGDSGFQSTPPRQTSAAGVAGAAVVTDGSADRCRSTTVSAPVTVLTSPIRRLKPAGATRAPGHPSPHDALVNHNGLTASAMVSRSL